ncbi:hypothetical protein [Streptomyces sp. NBC_00199]|uniref:hypothetical protein n=1 Tax=Streptomyces sp. NBC_00199 TaxID=2975678 RepID=UPI0022543ABE|nr:hypothetical protein [Streptomyces sp. NBC_00199]MCX5266102.1 hypothetical protein [Streptomyces sp. NBC_00199]
MTAEQRTWNAMDLPYWQYMGYRCVLCNASLMQGGREVGRAVYERAGKKTSFEVYGCSPQCRPKAKSGGSQ